MNRRNFLSSLLASATLDPERLFWVPGKKTISIPAPKSRNVIFNSFDSLHFDEQFGRMLRNQSIFRELVSSGKIEAPCERDYRIPFSRSLGFKVIARSNG